MPGSLKPSFENVGDRWEPGENVNQSEAALPERAHRPGVEPDSLFRKALHWLHRDDDTVQFLVPVSAEKALEECRRRGLVDRELGPRQGSRHWRVQMPGRRGTLELSEWDGRVWVKAQPEEEGKWAGRVAWELARPELGPD